MIPVARRRKMMSSLFVGFCALSVLVALAPLAFILFFVVTQGIRAALFYARTGIVGAVMLGFGRALGETMAVTMVIGNNPKVSLSLFAPQYTMSAVLANEFAEAADPLYISSLVEIGLVLFAITLVINVISRAFIWSLGRQTRSKPARTATIPAAESA